MCIRRLVAMLCAMAAVCGMSRAALAQKALLIIAPAQFQSALKEYTAYKKHQLPTHLVPLEAVLSTTQGADDPERVKRYIYDEWKKSNVGYVLLVGDADVMPVRYMVLDRVTPAAFDYAFYPSDLYYADVARPDGSFDDWNGNKTSFHAGYYGEVHGEKNKQDPINFDSVTYKETVAVGRWPVSTPDEVHTVAAKTMRYEQGVVSGSKPGLRRMGLVAVGGWVDSRSMMDGIANAAPKGWSVDKRYYAGGGRNDGTPVPNETNLYALMNRGAGIICHAGHGSDDTWYMCCSDKHLDSVHNADRLPIMISAGCSTARLATLPPYEPYVDIEGKSHAGSDHGEVFTSPPPAPAPYQTGPNNPTGLGEQLLRRGPDGAVAYIGCDTGSQPCALTLEAGFMKSFQKMAHPRLGDCWAEAISYYYANEHLATLTPNADWYPPSIFFQGMKYLVFGDPSLLMPTPAN